MLDPGTHVSINILCAKFHVPIIRIKTEKRTAIMNIINAVGTKLDAILAEIIIENLIQRKIISEPAGKLMLSAVLARVYTNIAVRLRSFVRASTLKNMLLTQI